VFVIEHKNATHIQKSTLRSPDSAGFSTHTCITQVSGTLKGSASRNPPSWHVMVAWPTASSQSNIDSLNT